MLCVILLYTHIHTHTYKLVLVICFQNMILGFNVRNKGKPWMLTKIYPRILKKIKRELNKLKLGSDL